MTPVSQYLPAERRRAIRALLRKPLLTATGKTAAEYRLVRRHSEWLKQWLARLPDWNLQWDRDVVRLRKLPANLLDDTRPAIDLRSGATFTKRRYALLCLALAALEQSERQTTLRQLAQSIMKLVAADRDLQAAGLVFDEIHHDQRRDLVHAVRLLVDLGVLLRLDGDERNYLDRNESSNVLRDVLYDIHRPVLAAMLNVSRSPSAMEAEAPRFRNDSLRQRIAKLIDNPWIRARLVRALLDDPILYYRDLDEEERAYLDRHRDHLLRQISEATGLIAEVRLEGIAMVDPAGDLSDIQLPDDSAVEGTAGDLALLLVQWFASLAQTGDGAVIPLSIVEKYVEMHGLDKKNCEAGSAVRLTEEALLQLKALRLVELTADGVVPMAASGRYAVK